MKTFRSHGKLLITGEYVVLDGAKALAIPTKYGQSLTVEPKGDNAIVWKSYNELGEIWFEGEFSIDDTSTALSVTGENSNEVSNRLIQILKAAQKLNPEFLSDHQGFIITTHQDFNRKWGLGTSSTLINNIANWAEVDAYALLEPTFGGSGYDIACAQNNHPITFQLDADKRPIVNMVSFKPKFKNSLYFVYLNQKQNSRDGIKAYKSLNRVDDSIIKKVNQITESMITCGSLSTFNSLIDAHEHLISGLIGQEPVKAKLFHDFKGAIKSLGAWGGDFVLVTSETDPTDYFKHKGFETVIPFEDMVL
ncbi:GYDIA family GHMP kinase [Winogradskyella sp.]|uniref:GYDIA family GHMP kinase n=1 Tax=Winogradskyella sp. TaxID=1883156 RepID=UPI001B0CAFE0|nr:GYDIA family GHMP kinase [Winogradskyella sp.]MBO6880671.1 GHMP kinase [Winogradskyella sp.]